MKIRKKTGGLYPFIKELRHPGRITTLYEIEKLIKKNLKKEKKQR